jgi:hypothetical protein
MILLGSTMVSEHLALKFELSYVQDHACFIKLMLNIKLFWLDLFSGPNKSFKAQGFFNYQAK